MPSWTPKDQRQYEHIKDNLVEKGTPEEWASEIAGRTVNKTRRKQGRTPSRRTQGTGNPRRRLEDRTYQELLNLAAQRHIVGRGRMRKAELVQALRSSR